MYQITDYSKQQAAKLGVDIKASKNKNKKIDVFKDDYTLPVCNMCKRCRERNLRGITHNL